VKLNLKKISVGAVGAAVLLAAAAVVFSQQPQGPPPGPPPGGFRGGPGGPGGPPDGFGPRGPGGPGGPREGFGPGRPGGPGEGFGPFGPFGRDLNLTDDQRTAIQKIGESFRESNKALLDQMRTLHEGQADLLSGEFNEAAVRAAAEVRAKIQVELEISHARMMSQMVSVLTAEQKAQLAARRQQMQRMGPPMPAPAQPPL
jgi:Spy/CpxP family protein refolding chaperone